MGLHAPTPPPYTLGVLNSLVGVALERHQKGEEEGKGKEGKEGE